MSDKSAGIFASLLIIGIVGVIALMVASVLPGRQNVYAHILDRWWVSETRVTYTTTTVNCSPDGDGGVRCTPETTTHTRCNPKMTGRILPVEYPEAGCERRGDSVRRYVNVYVQWEEGDSTNNEQYTDRLRDINDWGLVNPDSYTELSFNLLGNVITEVGYND